MAYPQAVKPFPTSPPIESWELLEALPPGKRKEFLLECYCADIFTDADVDDCFARWPEMVGA